MVKRFIKSLGPKIGRNIKSFYIFFTEGAGVGKSHLIKTVLQV